MKILRVIGSGFEQGGAENGVVIVRPVLENMGHEVRVISSDFRSDQPRFSDYQFRRPPDHGIARIAFHFFNPHAYSTLRRVLREYQPDLVHFHTLHDASASVLYALGSTPGVLTVHGPEEYTTSLLPWFLPPSSFKTKPYDLHDLTQLGVARLFSAKYISTPLYRRGFRRIRRMVVLSRHMETRLRADGYSPVFVPMGVQLLNQRPLDVASRQLLYAGRLEAYKGVQYLIRAFSLVLTESPDAELTIAGEGPYANELADLAQELGVASRVHFRGHVPRPQMEDLYASATVTVMPSTWPEPFGKVGLEAMSVGRPVIASDVGGMGEWLTDGHGGYLVPPCDEEVLADRILRLFKDAGLLSAMGDEAVVAAGRFSVEAHCRSMVELYESCTHESGPPRRSAWSRPVSTAWAASRALRFSRDTGGGSQ